MRDNEEAVVRGVVSRLNHMFDSETRTITGAKGKSKGLIVAAALERRDAIASLTLELVSVLTRLKAK